MQRRIGVSVAAFLAALSGAATGLLAQDLPMDPRIVTGRLDNGLTYKVMKHSTPPGRALVWMHVSTGSLNETERQRGIAHYLEHMAFNGSANFAPGTVIDYFQGLGLRFGADQNAYTSFDQTVYQLDLPRIDMEILDKGLLFLSDVNSRLLLLPAEIEEERQIIIEEKNARKSGPARVSEYILERMAPGSIIGKRLPIGTEETILGVQKEDFVDYYSKWYGPSNTTIMVVADMDEQQVIERIKAAFDSADKAKPKPEDNPAGVKPYERSWSIIATDPELTRATISIRRIDVPRPPTTTEQQLRTDLVEGLAQAAFGRRMQEKVAAGKASFLSFGAGAGNQLSAMWVANATANGEPAKWRTILAEMGEELQRARAFGFFDTELEDARKDLLADLERSARTEATASASLFMSRMNQSVGSGEPAMSAAQLLELGRKHLPTISASEISEVFAKNFDPSAVLFVLQLPANVEAPSEDELTRLGVAALSVEPSRPEARARAGRLLEEAPAPGKLAEKSIHAETAITSGWFENGVRYHHRFMDYRKDSVTVSITLYGGELHEEADTRGLTGAAAIAWSRAATSRLSSTDVRDLLTGKNVSVRGGSSPNSLTLSVSGTPEDIEEGMKLAYLLLTDPRIEAPAFEQFKTATIQGLEAAEKAPMGVSARLMARTLYPAEAARVQPPTVDQIRALELDAAQAWLKKLIAESPIEVAVVGDLSAERAEALAAAYLGSLKARQRVSDETLKDRRVIQRPKLPLSAAADVETLTDQAMVTCGFFGPDRTSIGDVHALNLATQILSTRMIHEIREKEQLVYSIRAGLAPGGTYPGFGMIRAGAPTQPAKAEALAEKIGAMFAEFAQSGPTDEEIEVAKRQTLIALENSMREPGFWLSRLNTMTWDGSNPDELLAAPEAISGLTKTDILSAYRSYYGTGGLMTVIVKPKAPTGG